MPQFEYLMYLWRENDFRDAPSIAVDRFVLERYNQHSSGNIFDPVTPNQFIQESFPGS